MGRLTRLVTLTSDCTAFGISTRLISVVAGLVTIDNFSNVNGAPFQVAKALVAKACAFAGVISPTNVR